MHVSRYGDRGPTLLLLHGGMLTGTMWQQQVDEFCTSHRVVVPDLPGHGLSADDEIPSYAEIADDLAAELQADRSDDPEVTAVGLGIGGQILLELIGRHPALVGHAVVISALTQPLAEPSWRRALGPLPFPRQRRSADAFTEERLAFRLPLGLSESTTRALVVAGEREQREIIVSAAETAAAFPHGQALVVMGTGHDWVINRPDDFNHTLHTWVAGHPAR